MPYQSLGGSKYFFVLVDDFSRRTFIYFLKNKDETLGKFEEFKARVENELNLKIKDVRTDNGTEFTNHRFKNFLIKNGIHHQLSTTYSPQSNGVAEREENPPFDISEYSVVWRFGPLHNNIEVNLCLKVKKAYRVYDIITKKIEEVRSVKFVENEKGIDYAKNLQEDTNYDHFAYKKEEKIDIEIDLRTRPETSELNEETIPTLDQPNEERIVSENKYEWLEAMKEELYSINKHKVWTLVQRKKNMKIINCKWIFSIKSAPGEGVYRRKARLVAIGCNQKYGVEYEESFSPVIRKQSLRAIVALAAQLNLVITSYDVKTAYLYGELKETIFMKQPERFVEKEKGENEPFIGIEIKKTEYGFDLSQAHYIDKILKKFALEECNIVQTPGDRDQSFDECQDSKPVDRTLYQEMIGSLMYLATGTRPDISFNVSNLSRFCNDAREVHLTGVKRIYRYLKGTRDKMLRYKPSENSILASTDASWCSTSDAKSYSGYTVKLGNNLISWRSKKQSLVALATCEAELISICEGICEVKWIKGLLEELCKDANFPTTLKTDSQSAIKWIKSEKITSRTKHINRKLYFIKDAVEEGTIDLEFVRTILSAKQLYGRLLFDSLWISWNKARPGLTKAIASNHDLEGSDMEECEQREEESHTYGEVLKIIKTGELYTLRYFSGGHGKVKLVMGFLCYKCRVREMRLRAITYDGDEPAAHFFSQLESHPNFINLEPARQARKALSSLRGEPRKIAQDLALLNKTYEEVKESLCAVYPRRPSFTLQEFYELKCTSMAEIETYYKNKVRIGLAINLPKSTIVQALSNGVPPLKLPNNDHRARAEHLPPPWTRPHHILAVTVADNTGTHSVSSEGPTSGLFGPLHLRSTTSSNPKDRLGLQVSTRPQQRRAREKPSNAKFGSRNPPKLNEPTCTLNQHTPVISLRPYRTPYAYQKEIQDQVSQLLKHDIITPSSSPYSSPVTLVRKRDNTMRLCIDFRRVNELVPSDLHPLPLIETVLDNLSKARVFSTVDISNAYYQIPIAEESQPLLYFVTQQGQYNFKRLPFGFKSAPQIFERVITHRALRSYGRNYTISELECLAIVECVDKFRVYLLGTRFVIYSDHHALQWLKTIKDPTGRLFRWSLRLSAYVYEVKYLKGSRQYEADLLSRNPFCGFLSTGQIKDHQGELRRYTRYILNDKDLMTITRRGVTKIIVPPSLRGTLLQRAHHDFNHPGISQMTRLIAAQYYWDGMTNDIRTHVRTCSVCQLVKPPKGPIYGELGQLPPAVLPYELVSLDTISGFAKYGNSQTFLHVVVDHATRYAWAFPSRSTSILTYTQVIKKVMQFGSPKRLLTDRAPAFTSSKFRRFLIRHNIGQLLTTSNNPQANGLSERLNAAITGKLKLLRLQQPKTAWTKLLPQVLQAYNHTPHSVTGFPPSYLLLGSFPLQLSEHVQNYPKIDDARELAYQRTHERHLRDKARFDQTHRASDFEVGDLVLAKTYHHPDTGKLAPFFSGPYEILEIISPQIVWINRSNRPLSRETDTIHVNKLKHYTENEQFISPPVNDRDQPKNTFNFPI
ncbi:hypothetical protein LAZ67_13002062 [Cordylochernes scorpioides]|uniref:RNA-directed DNA polymerase n=1 Tax=Cordylochernes scorpioides TaxID=51811 RepID=A0ABY6L6A0_9ARAC|nr:hypothetical protein LAZ67_13002062 [Cordylochernes scorpioides]